MIYALIPLVLVLGGLGRRIAGGVLNQWFSRPGSRVMGDTPARLIFAAAVALAALLGGALWWHAALMVPAVWVGTTTGNFESMGMGRLQYSFAHDFFGMSAHALLSAILPTALAAYGVGWPAGWCAGLTMTAAPLYGLGWSIAGLRGATWMPVGLRGGAELGEALWGGACALGVFLAYA